MKNILLVTVALLGIAFFPKAQSVAVNTTGNIADASAMLDVSSSSKGFLPPRMTTIQRTAIPSPANGLIVFDTDTKTHWYFSESWKEISNAGGGSFTLPFIGTSADPNKVFSITNTGASSSRVAIHGKGSNVFTGLITANPIGVWGEEDGGTGVLGTSTSGIGVFGSSQNNKGVYGRSVGQFGTAGWFENTSTGNGIFARSDDGISGTIVIDNAENDNTAFKASTAGTGNAATFYKDNTTTNINNLYKPAVFIANISNGNALKISSLHAPSVNSAVQVEYAGQAYGINLSSTSGGILSTSTSTNKPAITANNFSGGEAIHASATIDFSETMYVENTGSFGHAIHAKATKETGMAIFGEATTNSISMAAIRGANNGIGAGVMGINGNSSFGIGVYGETNNGAGNGFAGYFVNNGSGTGSQALHTLNNSLGINTTIYTQNQANNKEALEVIHKGTGNIATFKNQNGEVGSISNNGNIKTTGTVTVKNNKGIVRSSSATQLRTEMIPASYVVAGIEILVPMAQRTVSITFGTSYSAAPAVYVGNITNQGLNAPVLHTSVIDVSATGCKLKIVNTTGQNVGISSCTWNLVVLGAE